jgi:hypothetical protein
MNQAPGVPFNEKTEGRKSRDTVPLSLIWSSLWYGKYVNSYLIHATQQMSRYAKTI